MLLAEFLRPTQRPSLRPKPLRSELEVSREAHFHMWWQWWDRGAPWSSEEEADETGADSTSDASQTARTG